LGVCALLIAGAIALGGTVDATAQSDPPATAEFVATPVFTFQLIGGAGSNASIVTGGRVTFSNEPGGSAEAHDVAFVQPGVACVQTLGGTSPDPWKFPIPPSQADWTGECTFSQAGVYPYVCTLHEEGMKGNITVTDSASTAPPPGGTTPPGGSSPPPPAGAPAPPPPPAGAIAATPLAVKVSAVQIGTTVRGTISGAKGSRRATIKVTAKRGAVRAAGTRTAAISVGRRNATTTKSGSLLFSVGLNAKARAAIARRGRLAVSVRVAVAPVTGATKTRIFRVDVRSGRAR